MPTKRTFRTCLGASVMEGIEMTRKYFLLSGRDEAR